jgi:hypothetical protein
MPLRSLLAMLVLLVPSLRAQSILPARFGRWTAIDSIPALPQPPDAQEVFVESGLENAEARAYTNAKTTVTVTSYRFHDSSGAYEAYTYSLNPNAGTRGASHANEVESARFVLIGNILMAVDNADYLSSDDKESLSRHLNTRADKTPPPPIPNYLPARDRISGTEKYALGPAAFRAASLSLGRQEYAVISDAVGFSSGAEAMFARYRTSREDAVLLLIEFPTPQLAGLHWKHLQQALPPSAKPNGTSIERKGSLLAIVLSPSSPAYAARVRDAVNYETQVTWNEPTHTITDPPITTVLAKIIIATGVFMLVAIVFGVAFGGVRVLMKTLFPGKVFDRPEQMDVLQLGLTSKRINSRDFY